MANLCVYSLNCSVCKGEFNSIQEWLKHLVQNDHQTLTRKECLEEEWDLKNVRGGCLVIFLTYGLTQKNAEKVIQCLSSWGKGGASITDFVWYEDRPRIGIVQFESRKQAKGIFDKANQQSENGSINIEGQRIYLKEAWKLHMLEWDAILPKDNCNIPEVTVPPPLSSSSTPDSSILDLENPSAPKTDNHPLCSGTSNVSRKRKLESDDIPVTSVKTFCSNDAVTTSTTSCDQFRATKWPDTLYIDKLPYPSLNNVLIVGPENSLQHQYQHIRNSVKISEIDFNRTIAAVKYLKQLFLENDPTAEVTLFRHWHLKLWTPDSSNELLIYVYNAKPHPKFADSFSCLPSSKLRIILGSESQKGHQTKISLRSNHMQKDRWILKCINPNHMDFNLSLATSSTFIVEVQVGRLLAYMCKFDPRCHPLLTLTYYWAHLNGISFRGEHLSDFSLPEPHAMQWLVIFFMCHEKYIPTPREIQERPHQILRDRLTNTDIGFEPDLQFAQEWVAKNSKNYFPSDSSDHGENFMCVVIQLFLEFLQFYGKKEKEQSCILNTRDGELIPIEMFLKEEDEWSNSKLAPNEIKLLRDHIRKNCFDIHLKDWKLYMIQPFIIQWRFSVARQEKMCMLLGLMKVTGERLGRFVNIMKTRGDNEAFKVCGSLEKILCFHAFQVNR